MSSINSICKWSFCNVAAQGGGSLIWSSNAFDMSMKHNTLFSVDRTCASKFYSMPCYTAIHYLLKEIQKTLTQNTEATKKKDT